MLVFLVYDAVVVAVLSIVYFLSLVVWFWHNRVRVSYNCRPWLQYRIWAHTNLLRSLAKVALNVENALSYLQYAFMGEVFSVC